MTHDVLDLARRWQDALARRDVRDLAEFYADDAVVESPLAGTVSGRGAIVDAQQALFSAFPDLTFAFEAALAGDDRAAVVAEAIGTHSGTVMGLPPTGRPLRFRLVFLLDLRDGKIVRDRRIYDFTGLLVQVGVLKAKPA